MSDASRRALRTLLQFIVSGGLTALVNEIANGLPTIWKLAVAAAWMLAVSYAQNWLEDNTNFPALLKAPPSPGENPVPDAP